MQVLLVCIGVHSWFQFLTLFMFIPFIPANPRRLARLSAPLLLALAIRASSQTPPAATWWSLRSLTAPPFPQIENRKSKIENPIDAFLLAKLASKHLFPSPPADRRTLIRRIYYDLIGLPPSPAEIDSFIGDRSPHAYEKVVDRLLASPRYGERWGRHWLDVVHYGDTHGYDKDKRRDRAWPYRDYVIRSLNADKPYSRFVREQLAGDVLWPEDPDGVIATGFIAAGPWDFVGQVELAEGTVEKEKTRLLDRDDMVSNAIATFDSVTIHCARCHDHKFDPIPMRDYYRLQAVFAGVDRGDRGYGPRAALEERRQALLDAREQLDKRLLATTTPETVRLDGEIRALGKQVALLPPPPAATSPSNGYHSDISATQNATRWVQIDLGTPRPIDRIVLVPARPTDFADTPGFGFPLRFKVETSDDPSFAKPTVLDDHTAADFPNPADRPYEIQPGGKQGRYVRITATRLWPRTGDFVFALAEAQVWSGGENIARGAAVAALDSIEAGRWSSRYLVDGFDSRQSLADGNRSAIQTEQERQELTGKLTHLKKQRREAALASLPEAERTADLLREQEIRRLDEQIGRLPPAEMVFAVRSHLPRAIHILNRGEVEQPKDLVGAGALSCVAGLQSDFHLAPDAPEGSRRAALAEWITDPGNMLTWRSIVNRVWHYHFGKGIVDTPNDFGKNGGRPSHPELLDWLAVWFRDHGQSLKALHRLIVTSAAYRQSSADNPACARVDADNRLLWRMNRQRLDAESIRDSVLAVSGALDLTMGGPGFDLFRFKDDHSPVYDYSAVEKINDPKAWRRTVYAFTVRSVENPFLECLDCADPNINTPVRNTTLTALQALALLNDPFILKQSALFAARVEKLAPDLAGRIDAAIRLGFGRPTTPSERTRLAAYAAKHGLANACRILLNTNEFVFID